jgi:hypothetical protein
VENSEIAVESQMDDDVTAGYVISEAERLRSAMQRITDTLREIIEKEEDLDAVKTKSAPLLMAF